MPKALPAILVVGGAGYIGSHICKELHRCGYIPVCYDNLIYGHTWAVKWGPFEKGDIKDQERLNQVFAAHRIEGVIHLAAFAYVGESVVEPAKYYSNNVAGTISLLDAMRNNKVKKIVFSSTCAVYGIPNTIPITEKEPMNPVNPYGASKMMVERILRDFHHAYGLGFVALRYFNAAGADPEAEIGEVHNPETHLIPLALDVVLGRREELAVFGNGYPTPDGTCIRDYIHVTDLARAHVLSLKQLENKGPVGLSVNLGTGKGTSVFEIINACKEISGRKVNYRIAPAREGDPPVLVADPSQAIKRLNWKADYADIRTVIQHAWEFQKKADTFV
ncbi:MAG: UDP-glucose 4-epimerase GalE [Chitinispirillaceae bacterium]|jgi:UDP-arabinose 4-epimerase